MTSRLIAIACCGFSACLASPVSPSRGPYLAVPPALQSTMTLLDEDAWQHPLLTEPMGAWVRRYVRRMVVDPALPPHVGALWVDATDTLHIRPDQVPPHLRVSLTASTILHETRHAEGYRHPCQRNGAFVDRALRDGGAFAVEIYYLQHVRETWQAERLQTLYIGCEAPGVF